MKLDNSAFDPKAFMDMLPIVAPKLATMLQTIYDNDAKDLKTHGKTFKTVIYVDSKSALYGGRLVAGALHAAGVPPAVSRGSMLDPSNPGGGYAVLTASEFFGKSISVKLRKDILTAFNSRPDNIYGERIRFLIIDASYREGIDLFDIGYLHVLEPLLSAADLRQVVGRCTRLCGHEGLPFDPVKGWPLYVFRYTSTIPLELRGHYKAPTLFDLYRTYAPNTETRILALIDVLDALTAEGAVDAPLTVAVHKFSLDSNSPKPKRRRIKNLYGLIATPRIFKTAAPAVIAPKEPTPKAPTVIASSIVATKSIKGGSSRAPRRIMNHADMRTYVLENFAEYAWPTPKLENLCLPDANAPGPKISTPDPIDEADEADDLDDPDQANEADQSGKRSEKIRSRTKTPWAPKQQEQEQATKTVKTIKTQKEYERSQTIKTQKEYEERRPKKEYERSPKPFKERRPQKERRFEKEYENERPNKKYERTPRTPMSPKKYERAPRTPMSPKKYERTPRTPMSPKKYERAPRTPKDQKKYDRTPLSPKKYERAPRTPKTPISPKKYERTPRALRTPKSPKKPLTPYMTVPSDTALARLGGGDGDPKAHLINFTPTQEFMKEYFRTESAYKGLLMYHSVGAGKTCSAIAAATNTFERDGYNIIWVTRYTLRQNLYKNMFEQVCHMGIREKVARGEPVSSTLSNAWLPPISFKQFSNLVSGKNALHTRLVEKNGRDDPLKKCLIIIDECHKLYASDMDIKERPETDLIEQAIWNSYARSGADSARVMLITATPYTTNPFDMMKLLNLIRPRDQLLPTEYDTFAKRFLTSDGTSFTPTGRQDYLDSIAGHVSYLNREKDARQFAYPIFKDIQVLMSQSPRSELMKALERLAYEVFRLEGKLKQTENGERAVHEKVRKDTQFIKSKCSGAQNRGKCEGLLQAAMGNYEREMVQDLRRQSADITRSLDTTRGTARRVQAALKDIKTDHSQEATLETRCGIPMKK